MIRFEDVIIKIGDFQLAANVTVPKGFYVSDWAIRRRKVNFFIVLERT